MVSLSGVLDENFFGGSSWYFDSKWKVYGVILMFTSLFFEVGSLFTITVQLFLFSSWDLNCYFGQSEL